MVIICQEARHPIYSVKLDEYWCQRWKWMFQFWFGDGWIHNFWWIGWILTPRLKMKISVWFWWQVRTYLIFVIFFTWAKFLENKIYTEKRQFFALNLSKMPIFRVKSVKNLHRPKKIYTDIFVGSVTNIRYVPSEFAFMQYS